MESQFKKKNVKKRIILAASHFSCIWSAAKIVIGEQEHVRTCGIKVYKYMWGQWSACHGHVDVNLKLIKHSESSQCPCASVAKPTPNILKTSSPAQTPRLSPLPKSFFGAQFLYPSVEKVSLSSTGILCSGGRLVLGFALFCIFQALII